MAGQPLRPAVSKGAKDKPFSAGCNVTQARWDSIFGKKHDKTEKGTWVWLDGKMVKQDESTPASNAPAIHDDRTFTRQWDYGAGRNWKDHGGRAGRKAWMRRGDADGNRIYEA